MTHMVIFRTAEGKPGYHQADTLEEAIRFVERLRNTEGVTDSRVFSMEEVPIEFRMVYRVEIVGTAPAPEPVDVQPEPEPVVAPALVEEPMPEPIPVNSGGGRFGLFGKG